MKQQFPKPVISSDGSLPAIKSSGRRKFLRDAGVTMAGMYFVPSLAWASDSHNAKLINARDFLSQKVYSVEEVDNWFDNKGSQFAEYDSELGWFLRDAKWSGSVNNMLTSTGVEGATWETTFDHQKFRERKMIAYADSHCRINTYGNSFTHCDQVNNGETWQELLANNLREPVRNFGIGGYSVYQAYLRMLKEEKRAPSDFIIFNIFEDDHYRNIWSWGTIRAGKDFRFFWPTLPYLTVNLSSGNCEQHKNICPTKESFYKLCNLEWVEKKFSNDFTLGIMLARANATQGNEDYARNILNATAKAYGSTSDIGDKENALSAAEKLHTKAGLLATMQVVNWTEEYARLNNKKVLYVLSYAACHQGERFDQEFVDFMDQKGVPYIDLLAAHRKEYNNFKGSISEYNALYWNGHYNPGGNFFTALALRDKVVGMLTPKPPAYKPL